MTEFYLNFKNCLKSEEGMVEWSVHDPVSEASQAAVPQNLDRCCFFSSG